jgi:hypothetical protein
MITWQKHPMNNLFSTQLSLWERSSPNRPSNVLKVGCKSQCHIALCVDDYVLICSCDEQEEQKRDSPMPQTEYKKTYGCETRIYLQRNRITASGMKGIFPTVDGAVKLTPNVTLSKVVLLITSFHA